MQIIFGRDGYAYSELLSYTKQKYLPVIAFMDGKRNLASEMRMGTPCNCKDTPKPEVTHLYMRDGSFTIQHMTGATSARNNPTEIKAGINAYKPQGENCVLAISDTMTHEGKVYFAWLKIDESMASLHNYDTFEFTYYSSPYTCFPSKMTMRLFNNYADAIAHVRQFIPDVEAAIVKMRYRSEAYQQKIADAKAGLHF